LEIDTSLLFESGEGYKGLFNNAHDLIHFADPEGNLIYVNKSWINSLEYNQEEIQGKTIYSFIDEADHDRFIEYRENILNGKTQDEKIIITLKTKNGRTIKIEGFIVVEKKNNELLYTTGIFRDVTKNLENEVRLKQNEHDLQQLLVYAPDAIIVIDQDGIIQFWNPKAEAIFGWNYAEIRGQKLTNTIIPAQYREAHENGMKRFLQTGEAHVLNKTIEITALNKAGHEFFVSLTISTTRQKGKAVFIAFIRDITLQKNTEAELEKNRRELEASNRELEQFAHVASHDMQEPIRKIKLFTERTIYEFEKVLPESAKNYLEKIYTGASRLTNLVKGILTYSTLTKTEEPFQEIELTEILRGIEDDLEIVIGEKKATIKYSLFPKLSGIPFLIYQLFYNLINNSLKFSKHDVAPVIEISGKVLAKKDLPDCAAIDKNLSYALILIQDNGIGFSSEFSDKIFHAFTQLNSKDKYEGTGLGLALCKNIVGRHHGCIMAEGNEDVGSAFKVILPLYVKK
jgi:two-component system sensor kinase FixL